MATKKTYKVVGFSKNESGNTIVRFTNKLQECIRVLKAHAIEKMQFFPLPQPMTKIEVARWLNSEYELAFDKRIAIAQVISTQQASL